MRLLAVVAVLVFITFSSLPFYASFLNRSIEHHPNIKIQEEYINNNLYDENKYNYNDNEQDIIIEEKIIQEKPFIPTPKKVITPKDPSQISFKSYFPRLLRKCEAATVTLAPSPSLLVEELEILRDNYSLQIVCSAEEHPEDRENTARDITFSRTLSFVVDANSNLLCKFFPDDNTETCLLKMIGNNLDGDLEREYKVEELTDEMMSRDLCWHCPALIHLDIPLPGHFVLADEHRNKLWYKGDGVTLNSGEKKTFWIIPLPELYENHLAAINSAVFNAWLEGGLVIQNVFISHKYEEFGDGTGGYRVEIEGKDSGEYELIIALYWIYGNGEPNQSDREPILLGTHTFHDASYCDLYRSEITGSRLRIRVTGPKFDIPITSGRKCTLVDEPGRWIYYDLVNPCVPVFCSGDRKASLITEPSWQGKRNSWIWVPYSCYYHLYTPEDISFCAKEKGINWIHFTGDSISREFVGYLMSVFNEPDTSKFQQADVNLNGLRITFQAWNDIIMEISTQERNIEFVEELLNHYNVLRPGTSATIESRRYLTYLDEIEVDRPDVFFMSPAVAYSLFHQQTSQYKKFVEEFVDLIKESEREGYLPESYWYGGAQLFGTAHVGTEFITQSRNENFASIAQELLKDTSMRYFDAVDITQGRWDESWDGLHYLSGYETWRGHAASMFVQVWLNELFGSCIGDN